MEEKITAWDDFHKECKMTLKEFIECVKYGLFIDYDGYGVYATEKGYTDIIIRPSDVHNSRYKKEYPYICWFNR